MSSDFDNADSVIDEIDAETLKPNRHAVTRALHRHMRLEHNEQQLALAAFDRGDQAAEMAKIKADVWAKIDTLDVADQGGLRLSLGLFGPDELIDWQLAGYYIMWSRQQGLSERQIIDAFHTIDGS